MIVQLVSKISNLCDPDPPTSQTDRWTDGRHAISIPRYALVHRAVMKSILKLFNNDATEYCCSEFCVRKPSRRDTNAPTDDTEQYSNPVALATTPDKRSGSTDTARDQSQPDYQQLNTVAASAERAVYEKIRPPKLRRQRRAESSQ